MSGNIISLDAAASEIKQACERASGEAARSPFFFLVGSGVSTPSVPLSATVRKECEDRARSLGRLSLPTSEDPNVVYSHWFRAAFPHRIQRQRYLRGLIDNATITHANLRLAHLLIDRSISNIVVTTNFDDLLSRALALFGEKHIVCDDPRTVERIDPEKSEIQIIHVHGSHWFYDCRNTTAEIEECALPSLDTTLTMAALLDKLLAFRSPIVCGYSGWENDVFMTALKRRLRTPLPYNMYWFCFHRCEYDALRKRLDHSDVYFILPPDERAEASSAEPAGALAGTAGGTERLSATTVFDALVRTVGAKTPPLINDPISFYAEHLRSSLPKDDVEEGGDIYAFRTVVERMERAKTREEEITKAQKNDTELEAARDAVRGARYDEVFSHVESIDKRTATEQQLKELMSIMEALCTGTVNISSATAVRACDLFFASSSILEGSGLQPDAAAFVNVALTKGNVNYAAKDYAAAIQAYEIALSRFSDSHDTETQRRVGMARNNMGLALRALNKYGDAVAAHDVVIGRLACSDNGDLVDVAVCAFAFKSTALFNLDRFHESIGAFAEANRLAAKVPNLSPYAKQSLTAAEATKIQAEAKLTEQDLQAPEATDT